MTLVEISFLKVLLSHLFDFSVAFTNKELSFKQSTLSLNLFISSLVIDGLKSGFLGSPFTLEVVIFNLKVLDFILKLFERVLCDGLSSHDINSLHIQIFVILQKHSLFVEHGLHLELLQLPLLLIDSLFLLLLVLLSFTDLLLETLIVSVKCINHPSILVELFLKSDLLLC